MQSLNNWVRMINNAESPLILSSLRRTFVEWLSARCKALSPDDKHAHLCYVAARSNYIRLVAGLPIMNRHVAEMRRQDSLEVDERIRRTEDWSSRSGAGVAGWRVGSTGAGPFSPVRRTAVSGNVDSASPDMEMPLSDHRQMKSTWLVACFVAVIAGGSSSAACIKVRPGGEDPRETSRGSRWSEQANTCSVQWRGAPSSRRRWSNSV